MRISAWREVMLTQPLWLGYVTLRQETAVTRLVVERRRLEPRERDLCVQNRALCCARNSPREMRKAPPLRAALDSGGRVGPTAGGGAREGGGARDARDAPPR